MSHTAGWSYIIHGQLYFHPSMSLGSSISATLCIQPKNWRAHSFYLIRWLWQSYLNNPRSNTVEWVEKLGSSAPNQARRKNNNFASGACLLSLPSSTGVLHDQPNVISSLFYSSFWVNFWNSIFIFNIDCNNVIYNCFNSK